MQKKKKSSRKEDNKKRTNHCEKDGFPIEGMDQSINWGVEMKETG